jgi:vacuolar-type H+-ATPase subunit F/Vma7
VTAVSRAAVIGEAALVRGYGLAGALVLSAESAGEALTAWRSLPADVSVVLLTAQAVRWLGDPPRPRDVLVVAMPS